MTAADTITTAEQLLHSPGLGRCELVRGELIMMSPAGFEHGRIIVNATTALAAFVRGNAIGVLTGAETGFVIGRDPDTVRAPDVGLVLKARIPSNPVKGFFPGAPDLAVEVLSPDDRAGEVLEKVRDWLAAGTRSVWVVDPRTRTVTVHHSPAQVVILSETDTLGDEDLLPRFAVPVAEFFAP
jgi:Uma2 family endonuclease